MVSLRRLRLLGLRSGLPNCSVVPFPMYFDDEGVAQFGPPPENQLNRFPMATTEKNRNKEIANSSSMLGSSSYQQQHDPSSPDQVAKTRRQHRGKNRHEQRRSSLRGVYFKNMKWQAAIKVDKKQIHLGTVGSQAEAARLYDRAAYMCGREPNYELPEEEKQDLKRLEWDEFLEKTRLEISNKKRRKRRSGAGGLNDKSDHPVQDLHEETRRGAECALVASSSEVVELEESMF